MDTTAQQVGLFFEIYFLRNTRIFLDATILQVDLFRSWSKFSLIYLKFRLLHLFFFLHVINNFRECRSTVLHIYTFHLRAANLKSDGNNTPPAKSTLIVRITLFLESQLNSNLQGVHTPPMIPVPQNIWNSSSNFTYMT